MSVVEEMIMNVSALPEPLHRLIKAEKANVWESGGEIRIVPVYDSLETDRWLKDGKHCAGLG